MMVIGLTGGTGSGKSFVAAILKRYSVLWIDADEIAHEVILPGKAAYHELVEHFGPGIVEEGQWINRKELGKIVFSDPNELAFLNDCTHKYIIAEIKGRIEQAKKGRTGNPAILLDAPLLIEGGLHLLCDEVWVVSARKETRIKRIMKRDNISYELAEKRIAAQRTDEQYRAYATKVIQNDGSEEETVKKIQGIAMEKHWE